MNRGLTLLASIAALTLAGCPAPSDIGGACDSASDCQSGLDCGTSFPDGYCFKDCTSRGHSACDSLGTACVTIGSSTKSSCYEECNTSYSCRAGYTCLKVANLPGGYSGICYPN